MALLSGGLSSLALAFVGIVAALVPIQRSFDISQLMRRTTCVEMPLGRFTEITEWSGEGLTDLIRQVVPEVELKITKNRLFVHGTAIAQWKARRVIHLLLEVP